MLKLDEYELMAIEHMGAVVIERDHPVVLRVGTFVGLYIDAEFNAAVVDMQKRGSVWLYTLVAVRS